MFHTLGATVLDSATLEHSACFLEHSAWPPSQTVWSNIENKFLVVLEFSNNPDSISMAYEALCFYMSPRSHLELLFFWLTKLRPFFLNSNVGDFFPESWCFLFPLCGMSYSQIANHMFSSLMSFKTSEMSLRLSLMSTLKSLSQSFSVNSIVFYCPDSNHHWYFLALSYFLSYYHQIIPSS